MCKQLLYLNSFVLVLSLVSNTSGMQIDVDGGPPVITPQTPEAWPSTWPASMNITGPVAF